MAVLADLPTELLGEIAKNVAQDSEQEALAALALQSRLLYSVVNPLLYRQVRITDLEQLGGWVSTIEGWERRACDGDDAREMPVTHKLSFESLAQDLPSACDHCDSQEHATQDHDQNLEILMPLTATTFFSHLHSLSFVDCEATAELLARLLGPLAPLRSILEELTLAQTGREHNRALQYIFQYLHFYPDTHVACRDVDTDEEETDTDGKVIGLDILKAQALNSFDSFDELHIDAGGNDTGIIELVRGQSLSPHPFTNLSILTLALESFEGEEIFIIFCGALFPILRCLTLTGTLKFWDLIAEERFLYRRAVHRSPTQLPAEFRPPQLLRETPVASDIQALWAPLSAKEISSKAFREYRGPSLDLLDLSELRLRLV